MAIGDPYASLPELKSWLKIDNAVDDSELSIALNAASRNIEDFCNRQFNNAGSATARRYRPDNECWVIVDDFHTTSGLVVKTDEDDDGIYETTWTTSDFEVYPTNGVVSGRSGFPYWEIRPAGTSLIFPTVNLKRPAVQVTAEWGWATVPDPVKQACLLLAAEGFKLKDSPFGVAGFGDFGVVRVRNNPVVARLLTPYQRDGWLTVTT